MQNGIVFFRLAEVSQVSQAYSFFPRTCAGGGPAERYRRSEAARLLWLPVVVFSIFSGVSVVPQSGNCFSWDFCCSESRCGGALGVTYPWLNCDDCGLWEPSLTAPAGAERAELGLESNHEVL